MHLRSLLTLGVAALLTILAGLPAQAAAAPSPSIPPSIPPGPAAGDSSTRQPAQVGTQTPTTHSGRHSSARPGAAPEVTPMSPPAQALLGTLPAVGQAPPNPTGNIAPVPAFPDDCFFAPAGLPCVSNEIAALNHARATMHQPPYSLPATFNELTPGAQLLLLSNADRGMYGLPPVLSYNGTLNGFAQQGALNDVDPTPPNSVGNQLAAGWSANWAGGIPTVVQAYYEWMYRDGLGSNNIDCTAGERAGCWGHREDTLLNFGSSKLHMGFGAVTDDRLFAWSFATIYWANKSTGSIPYQPVVFGTSPKTAAAGGGTRITVTGAGFTGATSVHLGSKTAPPTVENNNTLTFPAPAGTGAPQVSINGPGGLSTASMAGAISYLTRPTAGSYVAVPPTRILDTRGGLGAAKAQLRANGSLALQVAGRGGVPTSGVSSVMLNVTAVNPIGSGYLTVYPNGSAKPNSSHVNFQNRQTTANSVFVPLAANGRISLTNSSGISVTLIADVMGYVLRGAAAPAGAMIPVPPVRLLDTRRGLGSARARLPAGGSMAVRMAGRGGVPATGASAVLVNITAVTPRAVGYVTAWSVNAARPGTSTLNLRAGQSTPNLAMVPLGGSGQIALFNGSAFPVDLVVDIEGYIKAGSTNTIGAVVPLTPIRLMDTRSGVGIGPYAPFVTKPDAGSVWVVGQSAPVPLQVTGRGGVPPSGVSAVILNVTGITPNAGGSLTAFATGSGRPNTSNLNYIVGQNVPNLVVAPVGPGGLVSFFPASAGSAGLLVDVFGYVLSPQA